MKLKYLSADGLYTTVKSSFSKVADHRRGSVTYSIEDTLLTAMSAFSLKYQSFNSFYKDLEEYPYKQKNIRSLFKVKNVPSMTRIKEVLDPVNTKELRRSFKALFQSFQRSKKLLDFKYLNHYLLAFDGVEYFQSQKISCKRCLVKKRKSGIQYSHQMLAGCLVNPDLKQVIALYPEPIENGDGTKKNDCERNASMRFFEGVRKDHPRLPLIVTGDGLSSNAPLIKKLQFLDMKFILTVKPSGNKSLFSFIEGIKLEQVQEVIFSGQRVKKRVTRTASFINDVPLNNANSDLKVNFLMLEEIHEKQVGTNWIHLKKSTFSWVSDLIITEKNALEIARGGRKRWAIENETFNTLKNQSYNFEHNYGHGDDHLGTNLAVLMMLTFLVDQLQEYCCSTFQELKDLYEWKNKMWEKILTHFETLNIESNWHGFFTYILNRKTFIDSC